MNDREILKLDNLIRRTLDIEDSELVEDILTDFLSDTTIHTKSFLEIQADLIHYLAPEPVEDDLIIPKHVPRVGVTHPQAQTVGTPYEILKNIYQHQAHTSHHPQAKTEEIGRVKAILSFLPKNARIELDRFEVSNAKTFSGDPNTDPHRLNIYYFTKPIDPRKQTIVFLAHYDVVDISGDNVVDNAASVANAIAVGKQAAQQDLPVNVVVALTDAEEIVSFTSSGSKRLADKINAGYFGDVKEAINFELTAYGTIKWISGTGALSANKEFRPVKVPYNDATVLERNGIPATCVGIFTIEDEQEVQQRGYCKSWHHCHQLSDTFELANQKDMDSFAYWFLKYLQTNS